MTLKEKEKRWRQLRKKKLKAKQDWFVYYLPKEDYYGHTYDLKTRLKVHKYSGRDITNYNKWTYNKTIKKSLLGKSLKKG